MKRNVTIKPRKATKKSIGSTKGRYKYSYAQMRSYAVRSTNINKQSKWIRRIYKQHANEAKKAGNTEQYSFYKGAQSKARGNIKKFGIAKYKREWRIAKTEEDLEKLFNQGKINTKQGKIILEDDGTGQKVIIYEGQAGYDEVLAMITTREKLAKAGL